jgi:hypothetical protein
LFLWEELPNVMLERIAVAKNKGMVSTLAAQFKDDNYLYFQSNADPFSLLSDPAA